MKEKFRIQDALRYGWTTFTGNVVFFVLMMLVIGIPLALLQRSVAGAPWYSLSSIFLRSVCALLRVVAAMAVIVVSLSWLDEGGFRRSRLDEIREQIVPYFLGSLLYSAIVGVGMILLVVPGVYWAVKYQFIPYLIIDRGLAPMEALKASGDLTEGYRMDLFLFLLAVIGANILGALAFGVGLLVSIPVTFLAHAWVYRRFQP